MRRWCWLGAELVAALLLGVALTGLVAPVARGLGVAGAAWARPALGALCLGVTVAAGEWLRRGFDEAG
ncbi:MAG: hypothetical protein AB7H88_01445 [Vicinamibacterales bacterium]